jgi:hypothetical protein
MSSSSSSVESVASGNEVSGGPSFILPDGLMHIIRFHRVLRLLLLLPPLPDSPTSANAEPSTFHRMTFTDRLLPKLCIVLSFFRPLTSQSAFFKLGARNPIAPTKSYTAKLLFSKSLKKLAIDNVAAEHTPFQFQTKCERGTS